MAGNHGSASGRNSVRRRQRRRNEAIIDVLSLVLIAVLVFIIVFFGIKIIKRDNQNNETQGSNSTTAENTIGSNESTTQTEESLEQTTEEPTEGTTEDADSPIMANGTHTVWVDAGHGGSDWGSAEWVRDENGNWLDTNGNVCLEASDNGAWVVREKSDNLELALALQKALEKRGVTVLMTRTDDTRVLNKEERVPRANDSKAECFISLHRNYMMNNDQENGIEIWGVNTEDFNNKPEKAKDQQLAEMIRDQLCEEKINKFRGILRNVAAWDDYSVLWRTNMPALILEMGFMSNASDNQLFRENIENYANAIADGIVSWLNSK